MFRDQDFRTLVKLTLGYAVVAAVLMAMQPVDGKVSTAMAGGNFEVPIAGIGGYFYQIASAE